MIESDASKDIALQSRVFYIPLQNFTTLLSCIFSSFQQITPKLGNFRPASDAELFMSRT